LRISTRLFTGQTSLFVDERPQCERRFTMMEARVLWLMCTGAMAVSADLDCWMLRSGAFVALIKGGTM
jgi:hypothetical protein